MQEFKFRGKLRRDYYGMNKGEWFISTGLVHQTDFYGSICDRYFIIDGGDTEAYDISPAYEVEPDTVGQFIGRRDIHGKEIFTGDIVEFVNHKLLCVVEWSSEYGFSLVGRGEHPYFRTSVHPGNNYEVVGNKWDNPELLE